MRQIHFLDDKVMGTETEWYTWGYGEGRCCRLWGENTKALKKNLKPFLVASKEVGPET
jgi:hypothetical protein